MTNAWNVLDTLTILCVMVAFVSRIIGVVYYTEDTKETDIRAFYVAQLFLAISAPLLFARVLSLSQIDDTLGPMTHVRGDVRCTRCQSACWHLFCHLKTPTRCASSH